MTTEQIKSEITGTVWKILVAEGDVVQLESELMILESMKMEIPVESSVSGRIKAILVAEGEAVDEDQDLVIIEFD
jgi:acetyl-CoA carboxylase biotin carboxyl carrier protein